MSVEACPRAAAADGGARAPRRRVEQGRRDDGALRRRGRRSAGRDLHRRRARERSSTPRWTGPRSLADMAEIRRAEMARARGSSASSRAGSASSTPACPRATRRRRCRRAASRSSRRGRGRARWCGGARVPPARDDRPTTRTAATRIPTTSCATRSRWRRSRRPATPTRYPDAGEPWQPLKLYYHMGFSRGRIAQLHEAMNAARPGVAVRRSGSSAGTARTTAKSAGHHPGRSAASTSRSATRRCSRTPPRSTRRALLRRPARPPAEIWPTEDFELARSLVDTDLPEDDLFAGIREP